MRIYGLLYFILISSCMGSKNLQPNPDVEVIGHRGHVSTYPENSIEGFLSAMTIGADALEMDLVISEDKQVVVSHEPFMKASYMLTPEGKPISRAKEEDYLLYEMIYDSIRKFDSGTRKVRKFRNQKRFRTYKPLLKEVFETVEAYRIKEELEPVNYYLEIKSLPQEYGISQPHPEEFVELVMQEISGHNIKNRVIVMSFDAAILNYLKTEYPEVAVSYLIYKSSIEEELKDLDFTPEVISPYFKQLKRPEDILNLHTRGIKVIPWTVNGKRHIRKMINLGVDGIISDYPERVLKAKNAVTD